MTFPRLKFGLKVPSFLGVVPPETDYSCSLEIFDLTAHVQKEPYPKFSAALGDTVNATQALVTKFVQLGDGQQSRILQSESFPECQKAQNEVGFFTNFRRDQGLTCT
jgi:hypothetical protein